MKTHSFLSLCFFLGLFGQAFAVKYSKKYEFIPRGMLIFLDDSENESGAVTRSFNAAISKGAGPIIASANVFINAKTDADKDVDLFLKPEHFAQYIIKGIDTEIVQNSNKIAGNLYLFFPKNILVTEKISEESFKIFDSVSPISELELQLGLKVNHMQTIDNFNDIDIPASKFNIEFSRRAGRMAGYFVDALIGTVETDYDHYDPSTGLPLKKTKPPRIFCERSCYKTAGNVSKIPIWSIYIEGHGSMDTIIYLDRYQFKNVLNYLDTKINTKIFVYFSCYSAGKNAELIYGSEKSYIAKTYQFPIVTYALTDAPVANAQYNCNFDKFLDEIIKEYIDIKKSMALLKAPCAKGTEATAPQIKLPGIEWFSVIQFDEFIAQIGSVLAQTRNPAKPLDVVKFFKSDPHAILLYAKNIPFELIINSKNMKAIISMIPGDATHKLKKISSTSVDSDEILKCFMAVDMLDPKKIFFIEEIGNYKDIIVYNKLIDAFDGTYETFAIFKYNGEIKMLNQVKGKYTYSFEQITPDDAHIKLYETLIEEMNKPENGGSSDIALLEKLIKEKSDKQQVLKANKAQYDGGEPDIAWEKTAEMCYPKVEGPELKTKLGALKDSLVMLQKKLSLLSGKLKVLKTRLG